MRDMKRITDRPKFYFKWIKENGQATHVSGFDYNDYLPRNNKPGKWLPTVKGKLIKCRHGYHLMKPRDIIPWGRLSYRLFLVEVRGGAYNSFRKILCRQFRLLREIDVPPPGNNYGLFSYHRNDQKKIVKALAKAGIKLINLPGDLRTTYRKYRKR